MYKVLSVDDWNLEDNILKFDGLIVVEGRPPSHIPVTLLTPAMVKEFCDTLSTLAKERQELLKLVGIVEQIMQMHVRLAKVLSYPVYLK